eukprot:15384310-Alexandrium_andersonii.AAC.1
MGGSLSEMPERRRDGCPCRSFVNDTHQAVSATSPATSSATSSAPRATLTERRAEQRAHG